MPYLVDVEGRSLAERTDASNRGSPLYRFARHDKFVLNGDFLVGT